jgi:Glycosyltransferase family 87
MPELDRLSDTEEIRNQKNLPVDSRPFLIGWLAYLVVITALAAFIWVPTGLTKRMDFRDMYVGGYLLRTDPAHLYDLARQKQLEDSFFGPHFGVIAFAHLAPEAVLMLPFSLLSYSSAYVCMVIFNISIIVACFFAARDALSKIFMPWQPRPGFAIFVYAPIFFAIAHGQDSLLLLLFYCLAWRHLSKGNSFTAGFFAALVLLKPHVGAIAGLLLCLRFGRRFLAGFVTGTAALAASCYMLIGYSGMMSYRSMLHQMSLLEGQGELVQKTLGVFPPTMPNLRGLFYVTIGRHLTSVQAFYAIAFVSLLILIWVLYAIRKVPQNEAFALAIFTAVLLSYYIQRSELAILLLPIVLLAPRPERSISWIVAVLYVLPILCTFFSPGDEMTLLYLVSIPTFAAVIFAATCRSVPQGLELVA